MARAFCLWIWLGVAAAPHPLAAQLKPAQKKPPQEKPAEPPEEDESLKPREYGFNPLQATKEIKVGEYYMKKGKHIAAAKRFEEATRWDPGNADAWLRLGEVREKMKNEAAAKEAYAKYIELAPEAKNVGAIRKKLEKK